MAEPARIAAITTTFFPNSHSGVLAAKFLTGFPTDEGLIPPRTRVVSTYIDQIHRNDVGLQLASQYGVPVYQSIPGALTLGTGELAVDGVLLIGEHGDYPRTALGQEMLPRRWLFEQVCGVLAEHGRPVPVFCDKHLSYRWADARWMYDTARELRVPLWAGSSLPVHWRRPNVEHPLGDPLDEALATGFHMLERYGFHALESLQCQVERRAGGETGVVAVTCLSGRDVWRSADEGRWPNDLADAALAATNPGPDRLEPERVSDPHVFLVEYADGLRGTVLMLGDDGYVRKFAYAGRRGGRIDAFEFHGDEGPNHAHFSYFGPGRRGLPALRPAAESGGADAAHHRGAGGGDDLPPPRRPAHRDPSPGNRLRADDRRGAPPHGLGTKRRLAGAGAHARARRHPGGRADPRRPGRHDSINTARLITSLNRNT